jgi:hypothetical protein
MVALVEVVEGAAKQDLNLNQVPRSLRVTIHVLKVGTPRRAAKVHTLLETATKPELMDVLLQVDLQILQAFTNQDLIL